MVYIYNNKFFTAQDIAPGVKRIYNTFINPEGFMNTYSYLVEGRERAMLIDTMFGYGNLRAFCRELTDKPVILVNTHGHGDHTGGNYDFDECYIHPKDIDALFKNDLDIPADVQKFKMDEAKHVAYPEYKDMFQLSDFCIIKPMVAHPIYNGDIFDLGGRKIEVIQVAGHTEGEIVLLDREIRAVYSGDACNSNTLIHFSKISVEEYRDNLINFKAYQNEFDMLYGGHEDMTPAVIDEGIALCEKVMNGTDAKENGECFDTKVIYAAPRAETLGHFNMTYDEKNIYKQKKTARVLSI